MGCSGALGAFSFLRGENDELFGKHICGGILTPTGCEAGGLEGSEVIKTFSHLWAVC